MDNKIQVVFITDNNYLVNTAVAIISLYENKSENSEYDVYLIITDDVENEGINKIKIISRDDFVIHIVKSPYSVDDFKLDETYVSPAAINKFYLADILSELDKVIYIDGDVIINGDLKKLYDIELNEEYAAVVRDILAENKLHIIKILQSNLKFYFNSGMMLLNLKKIRQDDLAQKLIKYKKYGINQFMDQDALNICFNGNVKYLSCEYNYMITMEKYFDGEFINKEYGLALDNTEIDRLSGAKIIHMTGGEKPWKEYVTYATELFMKYYKKCPFAEDNLFNPIRKTNNIETQYLFPYELIEKNSRIIVWGAGKVGQSYIKQLRFTRYCEVVAWVDTAWEDIKNVCEYIVSPDVVAEINFDKIVIAMNKKTVAMEIKKIIKEKGICENKIVWREPIFK